MALVRRNINEISKAKASRFADAVETMMRRERGGSVYERLASIHTRYCNHGIESFPGWHRMYLVIFEKNLQDADRKNGNDGRITVPYWDWINDPYIPSIILERFPVLPPHFGIKMNRGRPSSIRSYLLASGLRRSVREALHMKNHWRFASTWWNGMSGDSLESSHNRVHVACGYPMGSVPVAAFDPIFWLHHSNVDRIYESYLKFHPDAERQFYRFQKNREQSGNRNLFFNPLVPFRKPNNKFYFPEDSFSTVNYNYVYDRLITPEHTPFSLSDTFAYFANIDVTKLGEKCYQVHLFAFEQNAKNKEIPEKAEDFWQNPSYCGMESIFSKGEKCTTCNEKNYMNIFMDITAILNKLNIDRNDAELKVMCVETSDPDMPLRKIEETLITKPVLVGPFFNDIETLFIADPVAQEATNVNSTDSDDVKSFQNYLIWKNLLEFSEISIGVYDKKTEEAVKKFQFQCGLKTNGIVGVQTKFLITYPQCAYDCNEEDSMTFEKGTKKIRYWVGPQPPSISKEDILSEVEKAFNLWTPLTELEFQLEKTLENADIKIIWSDTISIDKSHLLSFEGRGLAVANVKGDKIVMDISEKWEIYSDENQDDDDSNRLFVLPVLAHLIGHVLGLKKHGQSIDDIMNAFFFPRAKFSAEDEKRITSVYKSKDK